MAGCVNLAVSMHLRQTVAVHAVHTGLIVDIGRTTGFTGKLWIDPAAMAGPTGLGLGPANKFVAGQQAYADTTDNRPPHMAVTAGGVTVVACFGEYLFIENLDFRGRKPGGNTLRKTVGRVVERGAVGFCFFAVTFAA